MNKRDGDSSRKPDDHTKTEKSEARAIPKASQQPTSPLDHFIETARKAREASVASPTLNLSSLLKPKPIDIEGIRKALEAMRLEARPAFSHLVPSTQVQKLEAEIAARRSDLQKRTIELQTEQKTRKELEAKLRQIEDDQKKLKEAEELAFILNRITPRAHAILFQNKDLRDKFFEKGEHRAYVVAIDIRRSTELMLKARRPDLFAGFMTELCDRLQTVIKDHFGVFDKFTGDGVLAFFPDFFTGPDAGYHAVAAAHEARAIFTLCYKEHRASFTSILTDVHLATGIDYGSVHLVRVADGLTVVGASVVYACRLSNGPGGVVLLNQGAFEKIADKYSKFFYIDEQELDIKHEGSVLCYNIKPGTAPFAPVEPSWLKDEVDEEPAAQVVPEASGERAADKDSPPNGTKTKSAVPAPRK